MRIEPNLDAVEQQRLAHLERLAARTIDGERLVEPVERQKRVEARGRQHDAPLAGVVAVGHRHAVGRDNRRVGDVGREDARLEQGAEPGVLAQRRERLGPLHDQRTRAVEDRVGQQLGSRLALPEAEVHEGRHVERAERHDGEPDDGNDSGDLLGSKADAHRFGSVRS